MAYKDPAKGKFRESGQVATVDDLDLTVSGTYTQAEVQAIADKVDELLEALRASGQKASE